MRNYTIPQDQMQRFHGTIVQYNGQPVYVSVAGSKWHLYKPSSVNKANSVLLHKALDPYCDGVDVSSLPLGYVNIPVKKTVRYLQRKPMKKYQQGISADVLRADLLPDSVNEDFFGAQDILYMQEFEDSVVGKYPSLDKALSLLEKQGQEGPAEIAIDRTIALSIDKLGIIKAYYRNELVGWMAPGKRVLNVPSSEMGWIVSHHLTGFGWEIN